MGSHQNDIVNQVHNYLDKTEALLDAYIDTGSEHDLFIASYIHGHFSVIAANLAHAVHSKDNKEASFAQWQAQTQYMLKKSIDDAIANNELAEADAKDVVNMRDSLFLNDNC